MYPPSTERLDVRALRERFHGVWLVPVTPFDESGETIDEAGLRKILLRALEAGIRIVVPGGNTGEYTSLSTPEAVHLLELTLDACGSNASVIAGIGGESRGAAELARHARGAGADGILIHYPRDPYLSESGLIQYYAALADAGDLPTVLYVREAGLSDRVLEAVLSVPNVIAVKYAIPDVLEFARLVMRFADTTWLCGLAEAWAPYFWLAGARGFTSGLANVAPERSLALFHALERGDLIRAMVLSRELVPFEELRTRDRGAANVQVVKEALVRLGAQTTSVVRPPLGPLPEGQMAELTAILENWEPLVPTERPAQAATAT